MHKKHLKRFNFVFKLSIGLDRFKPSKYPRANVLPQSSVKCYEMEWLSCNHWLLEKQRKPSFFYMKILLLNKGHKTISSLKSAQGLFCLFYAFDLVFNAFSIPVHTDDPAGVLSYCQNSSYLLYNMFSWHSRLLPLISGFLKRSTQGISI